MNLKIISAGAGSGKTYRLTSEMVRLLQSGVRASGIIATTFTSKAAAELQERVRTRLLEEGLVTQANDLSNALIGTVHGLGVKLLKRFAFEAGVSPAVDIIADEDQQLLFNQSLAMVLKPAIVEQMEHLCDRLGLNKRASYDWRSEVKRLTETARANAFDQTSLEASKTRSYTSFLEHLEPASEQSLEAYNTQLARELSDAIEYLTNNEDETKTTKTAIGTLKMLRRDLRLKGRLYWWELIKITKLKVGAKSREDVVDLKAFAAQHEQLSVFREDIKAYIDLLFDLAIKAIKEFESYKKQRGLIDYTDMEVFIKELLDHPQVQEVLAEELDLLMVDEFQDTSPIQLEIFLKLSKLAKHSIWVGDPKQSIYGFRGAEPQLMQAIIKQTGGVRPEDIQAHSWRSREDIVYCTNALFVKAFEELPEAQIALEPMRVKQGSSVFPAEPLEVGDALLHWAFEFDGTSRTTNQDWFNSCIATSIQQLLENKIYILPKGASNWRLAEPGDVAILCRSNKECNSVAEALHRAGLHAAIARAGLMNTAEAKLILACLKYILTKYDTLSIAEILLLADKVSIEDIIEGRLQYLQAKEAGEDTRSWAIDQEHIRALDELREQVQELSSSEILNLLLEELDLRRIIAAWGNVQQRLDNVDVLRRMAVEYEERCNRLHTAASLGGFLLWLYEIENDKDDKQASGESPEAVNVLTYHKSKGLEYPIVICHSLEQSLRADVWGIDIVSEREEVDLDDVLGGRWLRYWVNPYADQYRATPLQQRLDESLFYKKKVEQALAEEARILYVGMTRARDYLVFVSREKKPTKWLNRTWHAGREDFPTLDPNTNESPWTWKDQPLYINTPSGLSFSKEFPSVELSTTEVRYIESPYSKQEHLSYRIDLRLEDWSTICSVHAGRSLLYTSALPLLMQQEQATIAKGFKAFLAADWIDYPKAERLLMAQAHINRFELDDFVEAEAFLQQSSNYYNFLLQSYDIEQQLRKYPVRLHVEGRLFDTVLDLILVTKERVILFQHSGFTGDTKRWRKHALDALGTWSFLSQSALEDRFPNKSVEVWAHFVLGGGLVQIEAQAIAVQETE